jgi:putative transposase
VTDSDLIALLLRLAGENQNWGYSKIDRELLKLGYKIGRSTLRDILKRQHVPPAPERIGFSGLAASILIL